MKNKIKGLLIVALFFAVVPMFGQSIKLGHIDSNELLKIMPGRDSAESALQRSVVELESTLKTMQAEFEKAYGDFMQKEGEMSDLIKKTQEKKLQDMDNRIREFQQNAQEDLQEKRQTLLIPIINKAKDAIKEVGKENGYTYILDAGVGAVLYSRDSDDIMPLVKKKLNLK